MKNYRIHYQTPNKSVRDNIVIESNSLEEAVKEFKEDFPTFHVLDSNTNKQPKRK